MSFTQFHFHPGIQSGIRDAGYTSPTPIQQKAIPPILDGKDIIGLAQTGTGKTVAFVLPILQRLLKTHRTASSLSPSGLIMAPTRELAEQIHESITMMAIHTPVKSVAVYGGVVESIFK
jgi:superfamily II DNA/RNA helicase